MPSPRREVEAATSESLFREVNEHLHQVSAGTEPGVVGGFVCECSDVSCAAVLTIPLDVYDRVRRHGARFFVAPDDAHVDASLERVVERDSAYWVVEKVGLAGEVAEALDEEQPPPPGKGEP